MFCRNVGVLIHIERNMYIYIQNNLFIYMCIYIYIYMYTNMTCIKYIKGACNLKHICNPCEEPWWNTCMRKLTAEDLAAETSIEAYEELLRGHVPKFLKMAMA